MATPRKRPSSPRAPAATSKRAPSRAAARSPKRTAPRPPRRAAAAARDPAIGTIGWVDLTVADATALRDFYADVVGWKPKAFPMDGYSDFAMTTPHGGKEMAGVCHARGRNAGLPAQWLIYVVVADLDASLAAATRRGGAVLSGPREQMGGRFAVIRDPAGAVLALWQQLPG